MAKKKTKPLIEIHLQYSNDRGDPPSPWRWLVYRIENGQRTDYDNPKAPQTHPRWFTQEQAEDKVVALARELGITDTANEAAWAAAGAECVIHQPAEGTFKNWPD